MNDCKHSIFRDYGVNYLEHVMFPKPTFCVQP